jgi:hypothetical protein
MIAASLAAGYFYHIKPQVMGKIILFLAFAVTAMSLYAQETPPQVPPVKQPIKIKAPILPSRPVKINGDPEELPVKPNTLAFILTSHTWNLTRWWIIGNAGHSIADPAFKFLTGNTINCNLTTPEAKTSLQSGTYRINGNNVSITLKKGTNVTMDCNLIYNGSNQTLTGTYRLEVLPVANPPAGYAPGTVTGDMKLELKP